MATNAKTKQAVLTVAELAQRIGVKPESLRQRLRREGVPVAKVDRITTRGIQVCSAPPADYSARLIRRYEAARAGA